MIQIREYTAEDKVRLLELLQLNTPQYFAANEVQDFSSYLDTEVEGYYVLLYDDLIVGCGGINFEANKTIGIISWDVLHPAYQGKYLGTQLLKYRIEQLQSIISIQQIKVRTSQVAYVFYQKNGFELLSIAKDYWADGFDKYEMVYEENANAHEG